MKFQPSEYYRVNNEGKNKELLFFTGEQYEYFLSYFKSYILPHCSIVSCMHPNHFHFLIAADRTCLPFKPHGRLIPDLITNGFRKLFSEYAHHFNMNNNRTGALFRPKTQSVCLNPGELETTDKKDFLVRFISFIHNSPVEEGLVERAGKWNWSSMHEYEGKGEVICNFDFVQIFSQSDVSSDGVMIQ